MKNDDGALSFGTAIDMSGFDAGIEQIEGKVAGLTSNVEVETSKISQLLANVPTLNIEVVTNASQSLSTIDTAYAELDRVIDTNRSSVLALEEQYRQLGSEISNLGRQAATPAIQAEYDALKQQQTAIKENIALRKKIVTEAEKVGDELYQTEQRVMSGSGTPATRPRTTARSVPSTTTPKAGVMSRSPPVRRELKNPGPTCRPRA